MKTVCVSSLILVMSLCVTVPAAAQTQRGWEWSVAALIGGTLPLTVNGIEVSDPSVPLSLTIDGGKNKKAPSVGGRISALRQLTDRIDLGVAVDVATFRYDGKAGVSTRVTGTVAGMSVNDTEISAGDQTRVTMSMATLMVRWRRGATTTFPEGRWMPYLGVGAGNQHAHIKTAPSFKTNAPTFRVMGGIAVAVSRRMGVFGEYRYEHLSDEVTMDSTTTRLQLRTSHLAGGITVRF